VIDVLIVSLGATGGLRAADDALAASLRRAGATVEIARAEPVREWRTYALIELAWARSARRAALAAPEASAVVYSTTTAALLAPRPGAIRFDAPAAGNRPGRHGIWQRPVERRRFAAAGLLLPWSAGGLAEAPRTDTRAIVLPVPINPQASAGHLVEGCEVVAYGANPEKKGLDRVLAAWRSVRREGEELVVAGLEGRDEPGVRHVGTLAPQDFRALLARARVFATAPRREDYGLAQLEALAEGCVLATTPAPGPYAALPIARELDPRTVGTDLGAAIRTALDEPATGYAERARELLAPFSEAEADRIVREEVLPALTRGR
jgi:glycosyltransferase involved in cell wall biosynthesis